MSIPADDSQAKVSALEAMAQHKGGCDALLRACRLLRMHNMRDAADLLIEHVPSLTSEPDRLAERPS